jgi:hypothetical protein
MVAMFDTEHLLSLRNDQLHERKFNRHLSWRLKRQHSACAVVSSWSQRKLMRAGVKKPTVLPQWVFDFSINSWLAPAE